MTNASIGKTSEAGRAELEHFDVEEAIREVRRLGRSLIEATRHAKHRFREEWLEQLIERYRRLPGKPVIHLDDLSDEVVSTLSPSVRDVLYHHWRRLVEEYEYVGSMNRFRVLRDIVATGRASRWSKLGTWRRLTKLTGLRISELEPHVVAIRVSQTGTARLILRPKLPFNLATPWGARIIGYRGDAAAHAITQSGDSAITRLWVYHVGDPPLAFHSDSWTDEGCSKSNGDKAESCGRIYSRPQFIRMMRFITGDATVSGEPLEPRQVLDKIFQGDCLDILRTFPNGSVDLIVTSPPYAYNRKATYGGIPVNRYVEWFLPISEQLKRILKSDGSFILNVKERVVNGERGTYIYELVLAMRNQGWLWTEEYIWHKKNTYPGKWPNRFRDLWEHCYHFTKSKNFKMYQEAVMVPMGEWAVKRLAKLSETDKIRDESKTKSGFGKNVSKWVGRNLVYPGNVLHLATESGNKNHSATFPVSLPSWFISLFTKRGDSVLDPFMGSGTTAVAALRLGRHYTGMELNDDYYRVALRRIEDEKRRVGKGQPKLEAFMSPRAEI